METQKYRCNHCAEILELISPTPSQELTCPRCSSRDIEEYNACSLEINSPPWEYQCQGCQARFRVTAPRGPDEAKAIKCPVCRSKNVKWLALASFACATGG
jgi:DNA-directed RNA polymerase subunit RPC12/RpoP